VDSVLNRIHVAEPQKRDDKDRGIHIPLAVLAKREKKLLQLQQAKAKNVSYKDIVHYLRMFFHRMISRIMRMTLRMVWMTKLTFL